MSEHRPGKVVGGVCYSAEVWEDTNNKPSWRWVVQKAARDENGNPTGPWRDVGSGAEGTEVDAKRAAGKAIEVDTDP